MPAPDQLSNGELNAIVFTVLAFVALIWMAVWGRQ